MLFVNMLLLIVFAAIILILVSVIIFLLIKAKSALLASVVSIGLILLGIGSWYVSTPLIQSYVALAEHTKEADLDEGSVLGGSVLLIESLIAKDEENQYQLSDYNTLLMQTDSTLSTVRDSLIYERSSRQDAIKSISESLASKYEQEIKDGLVKIEELENRRIRVSFDERITFSSAEGQLNEKGKEVLGKAAPQMVDWLSTEDKLIRIEGHTDKVPINTDVYPSNWELSAFRAASTARFMAEELELPMDQIEAVGLAESFPVLVTVPERLNLEQNRRIEIYFESLLSSPKPDTLFAQAARL